MAAEDSYGVILGDSRVEYQDGSEDEVLAVIESVGDRSVDSPEWAEHIRDWPTRYHFSALRTNLLRPLVIAPGTRVLEIGCGTGPLTRHLGECGAEVLAVDGSLARARSARTRCAGMANVRVMCGTIDDVDETDFDLVLVIGVLEYAGAPPQAERPEDWLGTCVSRLAPDGALVLAIENQIGLKYLLGWDEDHHGVPWVGVRDYLDVSGARTWTRRDLAALFTRCGLPEQHWLYPFPDYKLPTVVLDEAVYRSPEAVGVIDAVVVHPVSDDAGGANLTVDTRDAHRVLLGAGLGEDVANSFLVVASATRPPVEALVDRSSVGWLSGDGRAPRWRRRRRLVPGPGGGMTVVTDGDLAERVNDWLFQAREAERGFAVGIPLDRQLVSAFAVPGTEAAAVVLQRWLDALPPVIEPAGAGAAEHPFAPIDGEPALPPECIDLKLSNFIESADGVHFIDDEWRTRGPVSRDLAVLRGLWWTAKDLIDDFVVLPWGSEIGVRDLTVELGRLGGVEVGDPALLERFLAGEALFQGLVHEVDPEGVRSALDAMVELRSVDVGIDRKPLEALGVAVRGQRVELDRLHTTVAELHAQSAATTADSERRIAELREVLHNTERELESMRSTKLFRWAEKPRRLYWSLRSRF
jgi:SAM-dependent methyltransferase